MANLLTYINTILKPYYKYITLFFLIVIFIAVARYAYDSYKNQKKQYGNVANKNNTASIISVYFFHVDWCPHCKDVEKSGAWTNFESKYNNTKVNGYLIKCYNIDCTDDNGEEVMQFDKEDKSTGIQPTTIRISELIEKYKVDSYPTIKLTKDDMIIDFDAKITEANLIKFVNSV